MKELIDDTLVPARGYYYLLDWNERNEWKYISENFGTNRLCDLELHQYKQLFKYATEQDYTSLGV